MRLDWHKEWSQTREGNVLIGIKCFLNTQAHVPVRMDYVLPGVRRTAASLFSSTYRLLVYTSLYLALIAVAEALTVIVFLDLPLSFAPVVVGLITFSVYVNDQLVDLKDGDISNQLEEEYVSRHEDVLYVFASVSYGLALSLSVWGGVLSFAIALIPGIAWILYASDIVSDVTSWIGIGLDRVKEIFLVNTGLVAVTWAVTLVFIPVAYGGSVVTPAVGTMFLYFLLRVFKNTEVANVPDVETDAARGVSTLPTVLDIRQTRWALHCLDAVTAVGLLYAVWMGYIPQLLSIALFAGLVYSTIVVAQIGAYSGEMPLTRYAEYEYLVVFGTLVVILLQRTPEIEVTVRQLMPSTVAAVLMIGIGIGISAGLLAWREYPEPGALPLVILLAGQSWWSATLFLEFQMPAFGTKLLLANVRWIGIVTIPVAWLLFALEYTGRNRYLQPRYVATVSVIPMLTAFLAVTGQFNSLLYQGAELVQSNGISYLDRTPGPWFWVITTYTYLLGLAGAIPLIGLIRSNELPFRGQSSALLIGIVVPWVTNVLYLTGTLSSPGFDPTPLAFGISGVAYLGALTRFQLLGSSPTPSRYARNFVYERMEQGAIVVDRSDFIIDINPKAAAMVETSVEDALGEPADEILPEYETLPDQEMESDKAVLHTGERGRSYEVTVSYITDPYGRTTSKILTVNDISEYVRRQQRLEVLVRAFRHNVRSKTQVLMGTADRAAVDSDDGPERIERGVAEIERIGQKVKEIIELFEKGREQTETVLLADIVHTHVDAVESNHPSVAVQCAAVPADVRVNAVIDMVFENVIENAVEHNTNSDPKLIVEVAVRDGWAQIETKDNGPGIDDHELGVIEQRSETKLDHARGFGLWSIVWGTEIAGGRVTFSENEHGGTTVCINVPIENPERQDPSRAGIPAEFENEI